MLGAPLSAGMVRRKTSSVRNVTQQRDRSLALPSEKRKVSDEGGTTSEDEGSAAMEPIDNAIVIDGGDTQEATTMCRYLFGVEEIMRQLDMIILFSEESMHALQGHRVSTPPTTWHTKQKTMSLWKVGKCPCGMRIVMKVISTTTRGCGLRYCLREHPSVWTALFLPWQTGLNSDHASRGGGEYLSSRLV